jgi:hypothetical protein
MYIIYSKVLSLSYHQALNLQKQHNYDVSMLLL